MIRYELSDAALRTKVDAVASTWRSRAKDRTNQHAAAKAYSGDSPKWSEIKAAYIELQSNKCAYCERPLEDPQYGKLEWDVEHFRPKKEVVAWPTPALAAERKLAYDFPTGGALSGGYYLLAHSPYNYAATCKPCNTPLKANFFPIEGQRKQDSREVRDYESERALLPFPLGSRGIKPETVIRFDGLMAVTKYRSGRRHRMGRVTIDFFDLNGRDTLLRQRADVISKLWMAFIVRDQVGGDPGKDATRVIDAAIALGAPQTNCARSFIAIYEDNPAHARALAKAAIAYLDSGS